MRAAQIVAPPVDVDAVRRRLLPNYLQKLKLLPLAVYFHRAPDSVFDTDYTQYVLGHVLDSLDYVWSKQDAEQTRGAA